MLLFLAKTERRYSSARVPEGGDAMTGVEVIVLNWLWANGLQAGGGKVSVCILTSLAN